MVEFINNNAKNISFSHTVLELNCGYYTWMSYKNDVNSCSKFRSTDKLSAKLKKLIIIYRKNLYYAQKL